MTKIRIVGVPRVEINHDGTRNGPLTTQVSADVSDDGLLFACYYYTTHPTGEFGFSVNPEIEPADYPPRMDAWNDYPFLRGLPARWKPVAEELRQFMYRESGLDAPPKPRAPASRRACRCAPRRR